MLDLKNAGLTELLNNFYTLTGLKLCIFDTDFEECASTPIKLYPLCLRARVFLSRCLLPLEGQYDTVLVTAHGALLCAIFRELLGTPMEDFWQNLLPHGGMRVMTVPRSARLRPVSATRAPSMRPVSRPSPVVPCSRKIT